MLLNGTDPDCIDYGLAWWAATATPVPAASPATRATLVLLLAALGALAFTRGRRAGV